MTAEVRANEMIDRLEAENARLVARAVEAEKAVTDLLSRRHQESRPEQRNTHEVLVAQESTLEAILGELKRANSTAREGAVSSVQIEESAKGPRVTVKLYAGSVAPVEEAIEDYGRGIRLAQEGQLRNWAETVASVHAR